MLLYCPADGCVYAVGGWEGHSRLDSVERYDPDTNTWADVPSLKMAVTSPAVVAYDGALYVTGGAILEDGDGIVSQHLKLEFSQLMTLCAGVGSEVRHQELELDRGGGDAHPPLRLGRLRSQRSVQLTYPSNGNNPIFKT